MGGWVGLECWLAGLSKCITNSAKVELGLNLETFDAYIKSIGEFDARTKDSLI